MVTLPRVVVSAPATGQGKTTVATGLMAALVRRGLAVSGHKVGPDYIDPGYHALACGRPGRNLDPHLVGEDRVLPLLRHGAATPTPADVAVVEGVMGLFDGKVGAGGFSSTAHVAALTRSPVVLVVDVSRSSRTLGAVVHGLATYDPAVEVAGVILNQVGSPRLVEEVSAAIRLPVLGAVPRDEAMSVPSRHLGLVPAAERAEAAATLDALAVRIEDAVDLDALLAVARSAPPLDGPAWAPSAEVAPPPGADPARRPVVAVAGGRAFTFRYAETTELLAAAGCEPVVFDPTTDPLPAGTAGVYLGGGFPEVHAAELADNTTLRSELGAAVAAGVPTVAECAGLLYLCESLDDTAMVGAVAATAAMAPRLTLRYPVAVAAGDSLLTRAGEQVTGHEFHRTRTTPEHGDGSVAGAPRAAWRIGDDVVEGFATDTLHASYLHTHWAGHPHLAQRFADAVHARARRRDGVVEVAGSRGPAAGGPAPRPSDPGADDLLAPRPPTPREVADPLRHHGDAETGAGLVDFAVNVYDGPRPPWLTAALRDSLEAVGAYPDPRDAEAGVATHHGRDPGEVLATAGAAEAFTLVARLRTWRRPVVVHPQFTEPHAALEQAGHAVTVVTTRPDDGFALDPASVPADADLVVVGNPTNPTGTVHPAATLRALVRPGRLVLVDEAFMDTVPGETETLAAGPLGGLVVTRSLTKHWSIPGVRAGYLLADPGVLADLRRAQTPWSVSTPALAAIAVCCTPAARAEAGARARTIAGWREHLVAGLTARGLTVAPSGTSYVLVRVGAGVHAALRGRGVAVRRADTFPGLDDTWVRVAVREPGTTARLLAAYDDLG